LTVCFDEIIPATIGTGTTETQLNGAAALQAPESARGLLEVIPWQVNNGAYTAAQGLMTEMRIASDDVSVEPKRFILDPIQGGLGATFVTFAPMLKARKLNVPLNGSERIRYYATAQIANTVAPLVGGTAVYTDGGVGRQQYYIKPDNETATGTTVNTRTTGNTITVTGGTQITDLQAVLTNAVVTVSESVCGTIEFQSSDFQTQLPYRVSLQPTGGLLGATGGHLHAALTHYHMPDGQGIPIPTSQCIINNFYTNRILFTAAGNFICGVSYVK
jgi:hypothetical protein